MTTEFKEGKVEGAVEDYDCSVEGYRKVCDGGRVWFSFSLFEIGTAIVSLLILWCQQKHPKLRYINGFVTLGGIVCGIIAVSVWF